MMMELTLNAPRTMAQLVASVSFVPATPTAANATEGDGFDASDFAHVASGMRGAHEAIARATMSNGFNVILAALDRAAISASISGGLRDIAAERQRQINTEGWTTDHDDQHKSGELATAAGIYALVAGSNDRRWIVQGLSGNDYIAAAMKLWPWEQAWFKPTDRRRDLIKAGALILAELDRLDRLAASPDTKEQQP